MQSVEGMKLVCHELALAGNDPEGSTVDDIVKDADRLISILSNKVHIFIAFFCVLILYMCKITL